MMKTKNPLLIKLLVAAPILVAYNMFADYSSTSDAMVLLQNISIGLCIHALVSALVNSKA